MSDNWIKIIPEDPDFVPDEISQQNAVAYFRTIALEAENVEASTSSCILFIDCGGNFERIACPSCRTTIKTQQWQNWMSQDYDGKTFALVQHVMPCCRALHTLHDLKYDFAQGFGRFVLSAMNPRIGVVAEEQRGRFEQILGCPVRVIYRHM